MKKVERINIIMRYINNRARFTISEIMREFSISRSTAIRDIRELKLWVCRLLLKREGMEVILS
jgi:predicted DNA-binding transcriptional regulator YafY